MENVEEVLSELNQFDTNPSSQIPQHLEEYLLHVAKTGYTEFPWTQVKSLFKVKLENVISEFTAATPVASVPAMPNVEEFKYEELRARIFEQLDSYTGVPFTVQRLCELITQPKKNYKRIDKFLRGLERVMLVVSTIDPTPVPAGGRLSNGYSSGDSLGTNQEVAASSGLVEMTGRLEESGPSETGKSDKSIFNGAATPPPVKPSDTADLGGSRRLGDSLESPAKRMRLSIEEDGGPCDSAHQASLPLQDGSPPGNECIAAPLAGATAGKTADSPVDPSTSANQSADSSPQVDDENMEIDTECTSSEARLELNTESEKEGREAASEAVPETEEAADTKVEREAESEVETAEPSSGAVQPGDTEPSPAAAAELSSVDSVPSNPADSGAANPTDEIDGESTTAMELECGAEEGISTSAESGPAKPIQVETNSEAEASTAEKDSVEDGPEVRGEEAEDTEDQQSVESSEAVKEPRSEEVGVADSSDEAELPRPAPVDQDGEPDQSEAAKSDSEAVSPGAAVDGAAQEETVDSSPDQSV